MQQPVLSIPANKSERLIHKWHVYMCPDRSPYTAHLQDAEYVCFRHEIKSINGATDMIYRVVKKFKIDLRGKTTKEALEGLDFEELGITILDLITYIRQYELDPVLKKELRARPHWLVFLSKSGNEALNHLPRPVPNGPFWTVYTRGELRDNTILPPKG